MATSTSSRQATRAPATAGFWPVLLCWVAVALDGFDLVVLGAVIPTLSATGALGFTDSSLTMASTVGLVGVGIGAVASARSTDRFGRRTTLIASIAVFSVLTLAVAVRPERHPVHRAPLPGRARPGRLPADRAGVHVRARPAGPRGIGGDPDDDRLPRRAPCSPRCWRCGWSTPTAGSRCSSSAAWPACSTLPVHVVKLPESESYLQAVADARERHRARLVQRSARRRAAAATCGSASACGSPRSWGCCWSTA